ncbi:2-dehydro-3-deoxygluconokinase [subsurface metagenome]
MKNIIEYVLYELTHNNSPEPAVTILGDLNYDYIYNSPPLERGKETIISEFTKNIAGAGGYVSCGLAKLGADVYLLTQLGDDEDGNLLFNEIARFGVKQEGIKIIKNKKSPFTLIFTAEKEETPRQVATYPGTLKTFSIDRVDYKAYIIKSNLVYSCNYFLLPRLREEIRFVFKFARDKKVLTSYDANVGGGWENEKALATLKNSIYPLTDIIFLNEREAYFLTRTYDPVEGIKRVNPGTNTVVIKLGAKGIIIRHWNKLYRISAFPLRVKVQDTVGAGDSFQTAFLYFHLRKFPIEICGILGAANAASTVLYKGGTEGQCDYKGITSFIKYYGIFDMGDGTIDIKL